MPEQIMTVLGPIAPEELGVTSMHEHILCDIMQRGGGTFWNVLDDEDMAIEELRHFKRAGGSAVVDVTPLDLGRNLDGLARVSRAAGVHIIAGSGFYVDSSYPPIVRERNSESLARYLVEDVTRPEPAPGIIGEVGSSRYGATPAEERSLRAAARAARRTGRCVSTHAAVGEHGLEQLAILSEEGLHPGQIIIGHCDSFWHLDLERDLSYCEAIMRQGATVAFDTIGWEEFQPDARRVERLAALLARGYAGQIVLGSDTCRRTYYHLMGGRGYDYLLSSFVPRLRAAGVGQDVIDTLLIANPRRLLTLKAPY
jgi:predicted metal-dependent phosphotriesterase family hydrolase